MTKQTISAWAVTQRGKVCRGWPIAQYAVYKWREEAEADCAKGQTVKRVTIRLSSARKGEGKK